MRSCKTRRIAGKLRSVLDYANQQPNPLCNKEGRFRDYRKALIFSEPSRVDPSGSKHREFLAREIMI